MWSPQSLISQTYLMEPTETEKPTTESRAFSDESGATPLTMESSIAQLPRMIDPMASHHQDSSHSSWNLTELLSQKRLIGTFPVSSSHTTGTKIWSFRHTYANVAAIFFTNRIDELFSLFSWKINFVLEFRSNFQQVGQVLVTQHHIPKAIIPFLTGLDEDTITKRYFYMTMLPHVKVPLGEDTDVNVTMDWNSPMGAPATRKNAYEQYGQDATPWTPSSYDMGSLYVTVGAQMQIAPKVNPNAYVRVWAYLTDLKYAAYTPLDQVL